MKNIHNQNVAELAHYIINSLLYAGVRYLLWWYKNFSLAFIFFRSFEAIVSPLNLESSWQPRYSTVSCCLMEWPYTVLAIHHTLMLQPQENINTSQKLSVWNIGLKPFNYWCPETKIFHFFKENSVV